MSTLKVSNIQDISNNAAMSISGGVTTFNNLPVNASAAGSGAFAARLTANEWGSVTDNAIVTFNNDSTGDSFDTDNNYNTSTYKYTAPATGVYMFWFTIYTADGDTSNGFGFLKNAAKVNMQNAPDNLFSFISGTNADHIQAASVVIPLASGDTMAVCGAVSSSDYYKGNSQWGGCRLA
jgi:hypothetical protein